MDMAVICLASEPAWNTVFGFVPDSVVQIGHAVAARVDDLPFLATATEQPGESFVSHR